MRRCRSPSSRITLICDMISSFSRRGNPCADRHPAPCLMATVDDSGCKRNCRLLRRRGPRAMAAGTEGEAPQIVAGLVSEESKKLIPCIRFPLSFFFLLLLRESLIYPVLSTSIISKVATHMMRNLRAHGRFFFEQETRLFPQMTDCKQRASRPTGFPTGATFSKIVFLPPFHFPRIPSEMPEMVCMKRSRRLLGVGRAQGNRCRSWLSRSLKGGGRRV